MKDTAETGLILGMVLLVWKDLQGKVSPVCYMNILAVPTNYILCHFDVETCVKISTAYDKLTKVLVETASKTKKEIINHKS